MILRRVIQHVKKQEWTAIWIDLVIVVVGVFIGIQVANWNEERAAKIKYQLAVERVNAEARENIKILDSAKKDYSRINEVGEALDILLTCNTQPGNEVIVNRGLDRLTGTIGFKLRDSALREMTESQVLLAMQSPKVREKYGQARVTLVFLQSQADYMETAPLVQRFENNPIVVIGTERKLARSFLGNDMPAVSSTKRRLSLAAPIEQACQNEQLKKSMYSWELHQSGVPLIIYDMENTINELLLVGGAP